MSDSNSTLVVQQRGDTGATDHANVFQNHQGRYHQQHIQHNQGFESTTPGSHREAISLYQCAHCQRRYSRPEHLARHVQTHTLGKRFFCPECNKGFARADLLKRHVANHTADESGLKKRKRTGDSPGRVSHACRACATARVKCEELKPCTRCRLRRITCEYVTPEAGSVAAMHLLHLSARGIGNGEQNPLPLPPQNTMFSTPESPSPLQQCQQSMGPETQLATPETLEPSTTDSFHGNFQDESQLMDGTRLPLSEFLRDIIGSESYDSNRGFEEHQDLAVLNFCNNADLEMSNMDFTDLKYYNYDASGYIMPQDRLSAGDYLITKAEDTMSEMRSKCANIWFDSPWRWLPEKSDNAFCEEDYLSVRPDEVNHSRVRESQGKANILTQDPLSQVSRDKLLTVVMIICSRKIREHVASAFPSLEVLDMLVQFFLASQLCQISSFIHHPSLKLNSQYPEWIAATVSAGAVLTPLQTLRKFGFALQEIVRLAIIDKWENDNALTRDLHLLQGFILQYEVGLWSANRRKMEISMAHTQASITMLRAAGKFKRSSYPPISVSPVDEGPILEDKWRKWAAQESYKRLVFHIYLRDVQTSMTTLVNPVISYTEITLPLPHPKELWFAKNAKEWKQVYLIKIAPHREKELSLGDLIRNISDLSANQTRIDPQLSALIYLHAIWVMIWEYRQFDTIHRPSASDTPNRSNMDEILSARNEELCKILYQFQGESSGWTKDLQETLVLNLLLMYLHVSLDDLQLFACKDGEEQARKIYPKLQDWVDTPKARQAIWYAAQVLRAAKNFPRNHLKDFYAVAVLHASLALWTYGVVTKAKRRSRSYEMTAMSAPEEHVFLDGLESEDTQNFIKFSKGNPMICGPDDRRGATPATSSVAEPRGCMEIASDILRAASKVEADEVPPIVDNMCNVIKQLGNAALEAGLG